MKTNESGFSLIELLIVIVIIGILAALSIQGILASRRSANEGSTVSSIRLLHGAQMTYSSSFGTGEFAGTVGAGTNAGLTILRGYELIDPVLGGGNKSGYNYVGGRQPATATEPSQFYFSAIPISADSLTGTGNHRFGVATDGVLRTDTVLTTHYPDIASINSAPAMGN